MIQPLVDVAAAFSDCGYEFPTAADGYDANWMRATLPITRGAKRANLVVRFLAWEAGWLARWLRGTVAGIASDSEFVLFERDVRLVHTMSSNRTHYFTLCIKSAQLLGDIECSEEPGIAILRGTTEEIDELCSKLDHLVVCYPPRGECGRQAELLPGPQLLEMP